MVERDRIYDHKVKMFLPRSAAASQAEKISIHLQIRIAEDMRIEEIYQTSKESKVKNAHYSWYVRASVETANEGIISSYRGFTI
jgi:hypothetical protein